MSTGPRADHPVRASRRMADVAYGMRGALAAEAERMRSRGEHVLALNLGDPAAYGLTPAPEVVRAVREQLDHSCGYSTAKGLPSARRAVAEHYRAKGLADVRPRDVYLGNGVSELAPMSLNALLDPRDEVLIPAPDYPMWTASVVVAGGRPVHYPCDEHADWYPDPAQISARVTDRTRAIVVINPNNPTGAVWPPDVLDAIADIARRHHLVLLADEIYADFLYDDTAHVPLASCAPDVACLTFGGLSKRSRIPGYRMGWMALTGPRGPAREYTDALDTLASLRLCPNVPVQRAVRAALAADDTPSLTAPDGALGRRREHIWNLLNAVPGVRSVKPQGAFYTFPSIDVRRCRIGDDDRLANELLREERLLIVPGNALGPVAPGHFRMVTLAPTDLLTDAAGRLARFLERRTARPSRTSSSHTPPTRKRKGVTARPVGHHHDLGEPR
ncbi:aminotransferase class I/II-fold pyridoxal phosphate-dependent enzyme [Streptomyces sp. SID3343]|uniref:aminotransferase class I/II-fold pyridoxal phosphate-dependent enzyme n=1 Tax=Streptomyces sp. SID3343 TaxID=2690260 RepID=UPI0013715A99|nr:aminotransferase class I/II-fold pyridoxal phosphate-dependent enzyme [Streptomyces sp. SID3343]MYW06660.1 aminotransferase class I/II-fold pyridoxal phosphate-dependent enzyme [Streptomyces sp. SID3343]